MIQGPKVAMATLINDLDQNHGQSERWTF